MAGNETADKISLRASLLAPISPTISTAVGISLNIWPKPALADWQGRTYAVRVLDEGFSWQGARYRSLFAIARQITRF
jgi:hypothetical protein